MSASEHNNRQKLEGQFKVLGNTSTYSVIQPLTFEAERYFGSGTEWCTVANKDYFDRYTNKGPLFILYPKDGNKENKMQFHFESNSFADYEDNVDGNPLECMEDVVYDKNELSELTKLCANIWKNKARDFMTFEEYLPIAIERISNGENPKDIFDWVDDFREGFALVELRGKCNFINQNGELINPNQWYDNTGDFSEGFARVYLREQGWNFINQNGELLSPNQWYNNTGDFSEGYAEVYLDGKGWNLINQNGELLSPNQWFDYVQPFSEGFAKIYLDEQGCNLINQNGELLSPNLWFDNTGSFREGFAVVNLDGQGWNFINQNGELLSPNQWFDWVGPFCEGFAWVYLNGEPYYINGKGELYDKYKKFIRNLRESVNGRRIDMIIESTLRKYLRR
jgi:Holliday junction resolvase-like predicted endonuclease